MKETKKSKKKDFEVLKFDPVDALAYALAMDLRKYERLGGDMTDLTANNVYSLIRKAENYHKSGFTLGVRSDRYEDPI